MNNLFRVTAAVGLLLAAGTAAAPSATAQQSGTIRGLVLTPAGNPAEDARVRVLGLGRHEHTDHEGRFEIEVPPGNLVIEVSSDRFGQSVQRVRLASGDVVDLTFQLEPMFHAEPIIASVGPEVRTQADLYQATDVLAGRELVQKGRNSLGETLAGQPGVNSTWYGPGSSRPVIRGLQGDRVKMLESGVSSGDVSASGPDHAVAVEPTLADQIEIIRGPSTLLYGSSAIGGAVNTLDPRIPRETSDHVLTGFAQLTGGSVNEELSGAASLNGSIGHVGWHASGLLRETSDYRIPGYAEPDPEPGEEKPGTLDNSAVETRNGSLGASWVGSAGYFGAAVTGYGTRYGVPAHEHGHEGEEPEGEEGVVIDLDQVRFDVEGAWSHGRGLLRNARLRAGYADYQHEELEGTEVGTRFDNRELDARAEITHGPLGSITGTWGVQYGSRDLAAEGEEAFLPDTRSHTFAAFLYEELPLGDLNLGMGARWEATSHETEDDLRRSQNGVSASLGLNWKLAEAVTVTASGSRSTKLPSADELFADGPHAATRLYEIGDPDLENEVGWSGDASVIVNEGVVTGELSGFVSAFDRFIYLAPTDSVASGFTVATYEQTDALFYGFELVLQLSLVHRPQNHLALNGAADYVRAEAMDPDEPLPFIPPLRWGGGALWEVGHWRLTADVRRVEEQTRVAEFETTTPGYTMLDASVSYRFFTGSLGHQLTLTGTNLTDEEARNHVSLLKDVAPLPGRDIRLVYRMTF